MPYATNPVDGVRTYFEDSGGAGPPVLFYTGFADPLEVAKASRLAGALPKSAWVKTDRRYPLVPRDSKRWRSLYRGRAAVEWESGRLKNEYGLAPLRVRGLACVQLHADLTMLARLAQALARARAVPLAA